MSQRFTIIGAATAALICISGAALAQTATTPKDGEGIGGCNSGSAADMAACQNANGSQQKDGSVGNGPTTGTQVDPGGIGGNQDTDNSTGGKVGNSTDNSNSSGNGQVGNTQQGGQNGSSSN